MRGSIWLQLFLDGDLLLLDVRDVDYDIVLKFTQACRSRSTASTELDATKRFAALKVVAMDSIPDERIQALSVVLENRDRSVLRPETPAPIQAGTLALR